MENTSLALASERTKRKDPTNFFNYYRGGWNISDEHYWAVSFFAPHTLFFGVIFLLQSAAFTAVPFFSIAIAWFTGFGMVLLFIFCCSCLCRRQRYYYSRSGFALSLTVLIIFTCTSIVGCIILYINQGKFHNNTINVFDYVKGQSNFIANNLQNLSSNMARAKNISVHRVFLPVDLQAKVGDTVKRVTISAEELSSRTSMNSRNSDNFLKTVRIDLIIGSAAMLLLVFLGLLFSILGQQFLVYCLVLIGWILIAAAFILCGVLGLLHNVVGDTCVAMDEWVLKPHAGTALDDILPCVDSATVAESLLRRKELVLELTNVVNDVIANISNADFRPPASPLNYNQSGPLMPMLCNPYAPDLRERKCLPSEVNFDDAPQAWKGFICKTKVISGKKMCSTAGRITPGIYDQMIVAANTSKRLYQYSPFLVMLTNCSFARETFSFIVADHCPGLELYSKRMYCSLIVFSASVLLSLVLWMGHVRERRRRTHFKQFIARRGQPQLVEENKL
ncbi:hypothetical protein KSP39_PZI018250 [Platanthera zijinensis]|uniref:Uncharacterized protein n=1 Tax=Platanthera zijinensis TaxID=2320716 RepID=A0AAP0FZ73_9ASPA